MHFIVLIRTVQWTMYTCILQKVLVQQMYILYNRLKFGVIQILYGKIN